VGTNPRSSGAFSSFFFVNIDIVLLIDGICTLANVIITNPIQANLVSLVVFFLWGGCDSGNLGEGKILL
jgi:hypothetical protein